MFSYLGEKEVAICFVEETGKLAELQLNEDTISEFTGIEMSNDKLIVTIPNNKNNIKNFIHLLHSKLDQLGYCGVIYILSTSFRRYLRIKEGTECQAEQFNVNYEIIDSVIVEGD